MQCSKAAGNVSGSNDSHGSELQAGYGFGSDEGSNPTGAPSQLAGTTGVRMHERYLCVHCKSRC